MQRDARKDRQDVVMARQARDAQASNVIPLRPAPDPQDASRTPRIRRSFGKISKLRSGRFQASYVAAGTRHLAPVTFLTKGDAAAWIDMRHAEMLEHRWRPVAPQAPAKITFTDYARTWLEERDLKPRTRAEYSKMLGFTDPKPGKDRTPGLIDHFGAAQLRDITSADVKEWYSALDPTKRTRRAHLYSLLRSIMTSAASDDLIDASPCRIAGASTAKRARKVTPATPAEISTIAAHMAPKYRAAVLLAAWCQPRWGELTELRRKDVELNPSAEPPFGLIHIRRAVTWPISNTPVVGSPKSDAGIRDVVIPPHVVGEIFAHIEKYAEPGPDGLLFPAQQGGHLNHGTIYKRFTEARNAAGRPDLRWHDLRHTGATMAARSGATLAELMGRLGHSTVSAALTYQHAASDRDAEIARKLSAMAERG